MLKNKRGSIQDLLLIGIILFFFSMLVLLCFKISDEFNTNIQSNVAVISGDSDGYARQSSTKINNTFSGAVDNSFLFLAIGLSIGMLVLASLVRVHPAFIILFIIAWIFLTFLCGVFSNVYQEMADNINLSEQANKLMFIDKIMTYLPLFMGVIGIILMIVMHKVGEQ